ncbi:hypothetical protein CXG81DRAFT_3890, partial [Caulochytrium protostelioides]
ENVFLFVPNLIGYGRVILAILAIANLKSHQWISMLFYSMSCLLDAVDGVAARHYGQTSKFGAVLDMVTDRTTTASLCVHLTVLLPSWAPLFQLLISLDLASHYIHMFASLSLGAASHKQLSKTANPLLRLYYTNHHVLFAVCAGNELFFIALYLATNMAKNQSERGLPWADATGFIPICVLGVLVAPIWFLKQVLNVVQMVGASRALARQDLADR